MHRTRLKAWPLSSRDPWSNTTGTRPIHCNYTSDITDELAEVPSTEQKHLSFFWYIYWLCYYSCPISTPSLNSIQPTPSPPHSLPIVHVHGSYLWVLWLLHFLHYSYPPPVYFPPIIYATYSLYLSPLSPSPNPLLITLHVISISVVLFLF